MPPSLFDDLRAQRYQPPTSARITPNFHARIARFCWNNVVAVCVLWLAIAAAATYGSWRSYQAPDVMALEIPHGQYSADLLAAAFPGLENLQTILLANGNAATLDQQRADLVNTLDQHKELYDLVFAPGAGDYYEANAMLYHPLAEVKARVAYALSLKPLFAAIAEAPNANSMATLVNEVSASIAQQRDPQGLEDLFTESAASVEALMIGVDRPVDWSKVADLNQASTATTATILAIPKSGAEAQARIFSLKLLDVIRNSSDTTSRLSQGETVKKARPQLPLNWPRVFAASIIGLVFMALVLALSLGRARLLLVTSVPIIVVAALAAFGLMTAARANWLAFWPFYAAVLLTTAHVTLRYSARVIVQAQGQGARQANVMLAAHNHGYELKYVAWVGAAIWAGLLLSSKSPVFAVALWFIVIILIGYVCVLTLTPTLFHMFPEAANWRAKDWLEPAHQALFESGQWQFLARSLVAALVAASLFVVFTQKPLKPLEPPDAPVNIIANSEAKAKDLIQSLKTVKAANSVRWIAMFLPDDAKTKLGILNELKDQFPRIDPVASQPPDDLRDQIDTLSESLKVIAATPQTKPALKKAADEFRRSLALLAATSADDQVKQLENRLFGGFNRLADKADLMASLTPPDLAHLPQELRRLFVSSEGQYRLEVLPAEGVSNKQLAFALRDAGFAPIHPALAFTENATAQVIAVIRILAIGLGLVALVLILRFRATYNLLMAAMAALAASVILLGAERLWQAEWNVQWLLTCMAVFSGYWITQVKTPMMGASTALSAMEAFLIPALTLSISLPFVLLGVTPLAQQFMPISIGLSLGALVVGLLQDHRPTDGPQLPFG